MTVAQWEKGAGLAEQWGTQPAESPTYADYSRRVEVRGKFLFLGDDKYWVKGVTYGTFRPNAEGDPFPARETVKADFEAMSDLGINTVRTYTAPPTWLLDLAREHNLRIMVGLGWEQHLAFLDNSSIRRRIELRIREGIRGCKGHPAVLCYAIGNEIPAPIVRWHGRRKIERFLKRLYRIARLEDPGGLVTYVNYPTTEYLQLPFLDLCCFNVYLEQEAVLRDYLNRLQNLAGDKPLIMAEIGLDSRSNGEEEQAAQLTWQIRAAFAAACAGTFVFSWTDEWNRGGFEIEDWDFGLCRRDRSPKPAMEAVRVAYQNAPFPLDFHWPRISVVICTFNGSPTIRDTLKSLLALDYPDYEVIVVNDGSTDNTPEIVSEYKVVPISTENRGLSNARNTGWQAANGEIVAYIDDDAYPDPHWLQFLAYTYSIGDYGAVGGLSPAPPGDGAIADCVANAPGRPVHVLISDTEAEHIPGCNMSFKREVLEALGGFDPRYRAAGDDVDMCWRVIEAGWKIGYQAGALNWHHCRNSIKTYWKQQQGYGKAEALLEEKWPDKYNTAGHFTWRGRLYGKGITEAVPIRKQRIYHGQWGGAPFQSIYAPGPTLATSLPLMPEWYLVCLLLAFLTLLGFIWPPLFMALPVLAVAVLMPIIQATRAALKAEFPTPRPKRWQRAGLRVISAWLHLQQPLARLIGRLRHGLTPWRNRSGGRGRFSMRTSVRKEIWSESWRSTQDWLAAFFERMRSSGVRAISSGDFDEWDIEVRGGLLGGARLLMTAEEHGEGKQLLRFRTKVHCSAWGRSLILLFLALAGLAVVTDAWPSAAVLSGIAVLLAARAHYEAMTATGAFASALNAFKAQVESGG